MARRPWFGFSREVLTELIEGFQEEIEVLEAREESANACVNITRAFALRAARRDLASARKERKLAKAQAYTDLYSAEAN